MKMEEMEMKKGVLISRVGYHLTFHCGELDLGPVSIDHRSDSICEFPSCQTVKSFHRSTSILRISVLASSSHRSTPPYTDPRMYTISPSAWYEPEFCTHGYSQSRVPGARALGYVRWYGGGGFGSCGLCDYATILSGMWVCDIVSDVGILWDVLWLSSTRWNRINRKFR